MSLRNIGWSTIVLLVFNFIVTPSANALTLSAKCQVNATRSKISVTAAGLSGNFWATAISGGIIKRSKAKPTNLQGVVSFTFDSDPKAILASATAIPVAFIQDNYVIVRLRASDTNRLLGAVGPTCTPLI
ncbi:MAG: hypothetical protein IPN42_04045 [Methylococcaceae bacterium]|nr:hypothetical protein [Methylococcaceae bacterium]